MPVHLGHSKCVYVVTRSLQIKVVVCFLILGAGRAVNVLVPYMYKIIGKVIMYCCNIIIINKQGTCISS